MLIPLLVAGCRAAEGRLSVIGDSACNYANWTDPSTFIEGREVLWPSLAGNAPAMFGNLAEAANAAPPVSPSWAMDLSTGTPIAPPDTSFQVLMPKAVAGPDGTLHVVWAEMPSRDAAVADHLLDPRVTELWYARLRDGVWSAPERIFEASYLRWHVRIADLAIHNDDIHLAFVATGVRERGFAHLHHATRNSGGEWTTRPLHPTWYPIYVSVAASANDVHIAFSTKDPESPDDSTDLNSVFVTSSFDGGANWSEPHRLQRSGRTGATDIRTLAAGDTAHVVWFQNHSGGLRAEALRHSVSSDRGRTWSDPVDVPFPENALAAARTAAIDRCGRIHVFVEFLADLNLRIDYLRWTPSAGWQSAQNPAPRMTAILPRRPGYMAAARPVAARLASGEIGLVYTVLTLDSTLAHWTPSMQYSRLRME